MYFTICDVQKCIERIWHEISKIEFCLQFFPFPVSLVVYWYKYKYKSLLFITVDYEYLL